MKAAAPAAAEYSRASDGRALRGIGAHAHGVAAGSGAHQLGSDEHALAAGLAGELQVRGVAVRHRAQGFGQDGPGGLDRVGVRLAAHVDGADVLRVDGRALQGPARRLHGHAGRVLVRGGHGFLLQHEAALVAGRVGAPDLGDLLSLDAVAGDVRAVADDADLDFWHARLRRA